MSLTPEEKRSAQQIFAAGEACEHCGGLHKRACPRIKRKAFHPNGNVIEVEYWAEYDETGIVWPEDAWDPEDSSEEQSG